MDLDIHYTFCDYREDAEALMKKNHYDLFIGMPFTSDYCAEIRFVRSKSIMESNLAYVHDGENNSRKCVAIARDSDLEFIRLINDYIYSLSDLQKTAFLEDGTAHLHHTTLLSYVLLHPIQAVVLCILLTAVVVVAISMMFHAKKMRKKNVELEVANHAKSEIL